MKTYLDCIPCFFRQVLEGSKIIGASPKAQKRIIDEFAGIIPEVSLNSTPPEIARFGYKLLEKISRDGDPYKKIKQKSNRLVLKLYGKLKNKVRRSRDRLLEAVELAIAGNVIDFGVKNTLNLNEELRKILSGEKKSVHKRNIFHYADFKQALRTKGDILYLADNAGEVVFDRILIEEIRRKYPEKIIYFAVKDKHTLVVVTADHETGGLTVNGGNLNGQDLDIHWSTGGHTGLPVVVYAFGPGAERFAGVYDNTDIPRKFADLLGIESFPVAMKKAALNF